MRLTFHASDICKVILAIILPPLGVFLEVGCSGQFWINVILTILGYIPGLIHAFWVIYTR
ncbi:Plasma membrane proteolipid 3 [Metarhizium anisopliae]